MSRKYALHMLQRTVALLTPPAINEAKFYSVISGFDAVSISCPLKHGVDLAGGVHSS